MINILKSFATTLKLLCFVLISEFILGMYKQTNKQTNGQIVFGPLVWRLPCRWGSVIRRGGLTVTMDSRRRQPGRSDGTELDSSIPNLLPILGSNSSNYVSTEPGDFYWKRRVKIFQTSFLPDWPATGPIKSDISNDIPSQPTHQPAGPDKIPPSPAPGTSHRTMERYQHIVAQY